MKYLSILATYFQLLYKVVFTSKRYTNEAIAELKQQTSVADAFFTPELTKRIQGYMIQMIVLSSWTCILRNKKLSEAERKQTLYLGAIIPISDDLTDHLKLTSVQIFEALKTDELQTNTTLQVAKFLYDGLMKNSGPNFKEALGKALQAQDNSILQVEHRRLTEEELKGITKAKGGYSTLMHRLLLNDDLQHGEKEANLALGFAFQQINDMFDVYKDFRNNQQTLYTTTQNMAQNNEHFQATVQDVYYRFLALNYQKQHIKKCLIQISTIIGRGQVCIQQLLALQTQSSGIFDLKNYQRSQLICDMEKPSNIMQSFRYSIKLHDELNKN